MCINYWKIYKYKWVCVCVCVGCTALKSKQNPAPHFSSLLSSAQWSAMIADFQMSNEKKVNG